MSSKHTPGPWAIALEETKAFESGLFALDIRRAFGQLSDEEKADAITEELNCMSADALKRLLNREGMKEI